MSLGRYRLQGQPQQKIRPEHLDRAAVVYQLSELLSESSQFRGQVMRYGHTVPAHDQTRRAAGSRGTGCSESMIPGSHAGCVIRPGW